MVAREMHDLAAQEKYRTPQMFKMPFVVARYTPEPVGVRAGEEGEALGLDLRRSRLNVESRVPIRAMDDRACLRYLHLSESEDECPQSERSHNNRSVSRRFYREPALEPFEVTQEPKGLVNQRLTELLERLPKN